MPPPIEVSVELRSYYTSLTLEPSDVLSFAYQIASGMEFLAGMGIVHRDLASRNILMTVSKYLKLADFGLSREMEELYVTQCCTELPYRWMAPEALTNQMFSEKSDVWSYGVVLWEICSLGRLPYYHVHGMDVRETVSSGGKLPQPVGCNPELYSVMMDNCWDMDPDKRATFSQLKKIIDHLITASKAQESPYMDLNFVVQEQLHEDCSVVLPRAPPAVHPPAAAKESEPAMVDLSSTPNQEPIPEEDCPASERDELGEPSVPLDSRSSNDPEHTTEQGHTLQATSQHDQQDEAAAEAIPLEDVGEPTIKVLDPSMAELEGPAIFVTSL